MGLLFPFALFKALSASSPRGLTYSSDGDANGVLYYLGTNLGADTFSNPGTSPRSQVVEVRDVDGAGTGVDLSDRGTAETFGGSSANGWAAVDLGAGRSMIVAKYSMRNRVSDGYRAMRNWKLQGSNDAVSNSVSDLAAATWADLDVRVADSSMTAVAGAWASYDVSGTPPAYRWLRILQNGLNSYGDNLFFINEWEFYGTFYP